MRRAPLLLLALVLVSTFLSAQPATSRRPMTFEDMMAMKRLGSTAVSPDGRWLAYSVTSVDLAGNSKTSQLHLRLIAGGQAIDAAVTQPGDSGLEFSPDNRRILFLSDRSGSPQVWIAAFDPATGATSDPHKLTSISTGAGNAIWSPDGHSVLFTSFVYPDCPAITPTDGGSGVPADGSSSVGWGAGDNCNARKDAALADSPVKARIFTHLLFRHWDHFTGQKRSHLFLASIPDGALRDLTPHQANDVPPFSLEGSGCGCAFSPDAKQIAYTVKDVPVPAISTNSDIFTLDLTNSEAKAVKVSTAPGGDFSPAYSPDGKYLAWRSQARAGYESDRFRLVLMDRKTKAIRDLLPRFDRWVDEFAWEPDSKHLAFVAGNQGNESLYSIGIDGGDLRRFNNIQGDWSGIHPGPLLAHGNERIIGSLMTVQSPPEAVLADLGQAADTTRPYTPIPITHLNTALLAQLDLAPMEPFWFTARDGVRLEGFILKPPHFDPARRYPVKFLIHGGPQGAWDQSWSYRWNPELFAASGYVVVMVNPRGSTGYGQAIIDGVNGDWGGKPYTDLMTGLNYAEQHFPYIDKTRECALGASYGGYMANWILGHTHRFRCIVTHDGMFNPESAYGSTDELWFNEWEFRGKPWDYYGKPDAQNPYRRWAPSLYARNFKTPTLVVHGQLDYRLDVSEGFQLFTTLQRLGVPSKMLYFPDEGHWVLKPQNSRLWWKTVNDWVDQWVGHGTAE
ncbi:MAG TPA: S9 family peptidase [Terracidiphilus sp.]|nr:S9 family peptidase [Terracidiphilus sp.]